MSWVDTKIAECRNWKEFRQLAESQCSEKDKGDLFERLTQLYLQTSSSYRTKFKNVWWCNRSELPETIRKKLNLPRSDEGIDLICETFDGRYWSVQSKYRTNSNRPLNTKELSKFAALSFVTGQNIEGGLIVHTSTKKVKKSELLGNSIEIGLQHWLAINQKQWATIIEICRGNKLKPPKKRPPHRHQKIPISKVKKHFSQRGVTRGKLIMPCGTGKSLTAYWMAQELKAKTIVVAVPSLALVKQSLEDWTTEYLAEGITPSWLAVCSDDSVGKMKETDSTVATVYEAGIPVTTDPSEIISFVRKRTNSPKVIFTTYQSSPMLAAACTKADLAIDLLIADEAHKTVGRKNKKFGTLLFDENVKFKKRIFMTATERVYRQGSDDIASMNDPQIYGTTFHEMSFKEAISEEIICDYKILTVAVSEHEVSQLMRDHADLIAESGNQRFETDAHNLAAGIAIKKTFKKYGIGHALSFHRSIKRAEDFAKQQEAFGTKLEDGNEVTNRTISSKLTAGQRSQLLEDFKEDERALISNAKCLTEGIDIPAIDCVAFIDPKQSKVDIVQAAGRAMRQSKETGKELGYILLPVIIPPNGDLNESLDSTDFKAIGRVITTLATQDSRIVEYLRNRKKEEPSDPTSVIVVEPDIIEALNIDYQSFYDTVTTKIWESVGRGNWRPFEEAKKFVAGLKLSSQADWFEYASTKDCPPDLPYSPHTVYPEWESWGDWLGTGFIATSKRIYRSFSGAKRFVHKLNLQSFKDWNDYCFGRRDDLPPKPEDVPRNPQRTYKKQWISWGDWLGNGLVATHLRRYRSFDEARKFVRKLGLKSEKGGRNKNDLELTWRNYKAGYLSETLGEKPEDIPSDPKKVYEEFTSWPDFLGNDQKPKDLDFWDYNTARDWVLKLELHARQIVRKDAGRKNAARNKWNDYCAGLYNDLPAKPLEIPTSIHHTYKDEGYRGYKHFITPD